MKLDKLKDKLEYIIGNGGDPEGDHMNAENLLLDYINDEEVSILFNSIEKWYS